MHIKALISVQANPDIDPGILAKISNDTNVIAVIRAHTGMDRRHQNDNLESPSSKESRDGEEDDSNWISLAPSDPNSEINETLWTRMGVEIESTVDISFGVDPYKGRKNTFFAIIKS